MRLLLKLISVLFILSSVSCTSVNIENLSYIPVTSTLSTQEIKFAILNAVKPKSKPEKITQYQKITDSALKAHFGFFYRGIGERGRWFVESIKKKSVVLGYDNGKHYVRVEYRIRNNKIYPRIDGSRNLGQTDSRIHKVVLQWLGQMETKIRRSLGSVSYLKSHTIN